MEAAPASDADTDSAARAWVATLASGDVTREQLEAFRGWCDTAPENRAAFDRARGQWAAAAAVEPAIRARASRRRWLRPVAASGLAAALVAMVAMPDLLFPPDYAAGEGPAQTIALADGSRVLLDAGSAIHVDLGENRRSIRLVRGRAYFEVAHDRSRPFVVSADGGTATAVGTAYAVELTEAGAETRVAEGVVNVASGGRSRLVHAGAAAAWRNSALAPVSADPDALAWTAGEILIDDQPLAEAAAELDRYIPGRVIVLGTARDARVGGVFSTSDAEQGLRAIAAAQGASVRRLGPLIFVSD